MPPNGSKASVALGRHQPSYIVRTGAGEDLDVWLEAASNSLIAAIAEPWSNGQTEGQINKLKNGQKADMRQTQDRPARSAVNRRGMTRCRIIKTALDPKVDPSLAER